MSPDEALAACKRYGDPSDGTRILHEFLDATRVLIRIGWPEEATRLWWRWSFQLSPWHGDGPTKGPAWEFHCALVRLEFGLRQVPGQAGAGCYVGFNERHTIRRIEVPLTPENIQAVHDLCDSLGIKGEKS